MLAGTLALYDVTRLLARRNAAHPTGIDRVDLAYAAEFRNRLQDQCCYVAQVDGELVHVPSPFADRYIDHLLGKWRRGADVPLPVEKEMARLGLMPNPPAAADTASGSRVKNEDIEYLFSLPYRERLAYVRDADLTQHLPKTLHWFAKSPATFRTPVLAGALTAAPLLRLAASIGSQIGRTMTPRSARPRPGLLNDALTSLLRQERGRMILYVNVSHHGIDNIAPYLLLRTEFSAEFVFFIHDIIPIQFPEYVRPGDSEKHARRMSTIAKLEPLVICNSTDTQRVLTQHFCAAGLGTIRSTVAYIGLEDHFLEATAEHSGFASDRPFFVTIGTLEGRKNHLLLLNLWREFATRLDKPPLLYLIGRRGWENEAVFNMLDRCPSLRGHVFELPDADDKTIASLVTGARALLFPTFAEGWGMPLVEAMALGAPAICSDLPVLREASNDLAEFIDPLDYVTWRNIILDYAKEDSPLRLAQLERLKQFHPPTWQAHFAKAMGFINSGLLGDADLARPLQQSADAPGSLASAALR